MPFNSFENYPMSWKPVLYKKSKALYKELSQILEEDIKSGALLPGTKLPPQRELADFLDINVSTVSKAFKACELKGLLSATMGSGTFVSYDALSNAYLLPFHKVETVIDMGATLPEPSSYDFILPFFRQMLTESDAEKWFHYQRSDSSYWQKDAAVHLMKKNGLETSAEQVLFSCGGQNAITASLAALCRHGDKIGTDPHIYSGLKTAAAMLGIQLVPIRQSKGEMDTAALQDACKNEGIKGIYIIPDCQNPTTATISDEKRREIAQTAREQSIFILEDATYHFISRKKTIPVASLAPERTIYIASMSKCMAPGLRLAFLSVPPAYKKPFMNALYNMNISVVPFMAELCARLIASGQAEVLFSEHRRKTAERNRLVDRYLKDYKCLGTEDCIFRWLLLPDGISGNTFEQMALEQGVMVYAAERFAVGNTPPAHAVRLSVCAPASMDELKRGLQILKRLLKALE